MSFLSKLMDFLDFTGRRKLERVFAGREALGPEDFYMKYFRELGYPKDLVVRVKKVFDEQISFDLSRLSAEDDFSRELKFIWNYDSLADVQTLIGLEEEFGLKFTDDEAAGMKTILSIVELIDAKLNRSALVQE